jgi:transmembrane sensor
MNSRDTTFKPTQTEQASLWWVRLREDDVAPEEISRWLDWCQSDPANLRAFERIESLGGRLAALDAETRAGMVRELLGEPEARRKRPSRRRRYLAVVTGFALAAGVGAIVLTGANLWRPGAAAPAALQSISYVTHKAQIEDVSLVDGSRVAIGADSALAVNYTQATRNLQLKDGEAFFEVEHNPDRPFVVQVGRLKVIAVGTAFNIRKTGDKIEVIVTHGAVDVEDGASQLASAAGHSPGLPKDGVIRVAAGQLVVADRGSPSLTVRPADRVAAVSWRTGSMSFLDEDLGLVIANLNRYAGREVQIADPSLEHLRFTGSVVQGHEDEWLAALQKVFPVTARETADGRVLLYRRVDTADAHGPPASL